MKNYHETLDYLYGLEKFGILFGLDNIKWLLSLIDNPHEALKTVHIAGTNGKGSVASMVSSVLRAAGYRTGAYTSPHLVSFTERITVNGEPITEKEVVELTQLIKGQIDEQGKESPFTFFDFTTALAFEYFKRKRVEAAVIEVGLGGRLDSTNVVLPLVSVVTNVEFDHQDYLGNTIEEIAREKAGIIKGHVPVVTGAKGRSLDVLKDTAAATGADLYALGGAFDYARKGEQLMSYRGIRMALNDLAVGLRGDHQLFNAALALCVIEILNGRGFVLGEEAIRSGISSVDWPGRLELIDRGEDNPPILLDGAHNPDGARALASFLRTHFPDRKKLLVFGVMRDKDFKEMLAELRPVVQQIILTRPRIPRAAAPADVLLHAPGADVIDSVKDAVEEASRAAGREGLVVIAGSFYTIGEAKETFHESQ